MSMERAWLENELSRTRGQLHTARERADAMSQLLQPAAMELAHLLNCIHGGSELTDDDEAEIQALIKKIGAFGGAKEV